MTFNSVALTLDDGEIDKMARPRKPKDDIDDEPYKLAESYVPNFSAAIPEWGKQISQELVSQANVKGSPGFDPGPEQAKQVENMAALGMSNHDICSILRIEPKLLEKFYEYELNTASGRMNNAVAKVALQMALCGQLPDMTKFWLKTRAGWKETVVKEVVGANGGPIEFAEVKRRMIEAVEAEIIDITPDDITDAEVIPDVS